jgi:hypothetical protein
MTFNWIHYRELNPDLGAHGLNSESDVVNHYYHHGINENRKISIYDEYPDFNWIQYRSNYIDLSDAFSTKNEFENHWMQHGRHEKRIYTNRTIPAEICVMQNEENIILPTNSLYPINIYSNQSINNISKTNIDNIDSLEYIYSNYDTSIDESNIVYTRKHNMPEIINCKKISFDIFNKYNNYILIIDFNNLGGGTSVFINMIISQYKATTLFLILRNHDNLIHFYINDEYLLDITYTDNKSIDILYDNRDKINKIFINHTINHSTFFINSLFKLGKHISIITHDLYQITNNPTPFYHDIANDIRKDIIINKYDTIITQNIKNISIFKKYLNKNQEIVISPLPDYVYSEKMIKTNNINTVIGFIGNIYNIKGSHYIENLYNYYKSDSNIRFIIFGSINLDIPIQQCIYNNIYELNKLLISYKPNIIIETSISPETYSYTTTLMMLTQLPIVYFKKNFDSVIEDRLSKYDKSYPIINISDLDNILFNIKQDYLFTIKPIIYFNSFWDNYFNIHTNNIKNIKLYCIYFPQFHQIKENDYSFYEGYNDIINLDLLSKDTKYDIESPSLSEFNLEGMTDYNLLNNDIIQKQIDIICNYDIDGFAMYYYWFSINTITNKNMIMKDVIDKFFQSELTASINMKERKIYFIWANESWSDNIAFGSNKIHLIKNEYSELAFNLNIDNLMFYFNHNNYLKIDNKPVLFLHHPWFLSNELIDLLYTLLDTRCKENNFNGIHFVINSMNDSYEKYTNYFHNFNYKKTSTTFYNSTTSCNIIDYEIYIKNHNNKSSIDTLVFNFDNKARLYKSDKLRQSTMCINNNNLNHIYFINKVLQNYIKPRSSIENILLINSWNEWGEKMAIEPSEQLGYYYLDLIKKYIRNV